MGELLSPLQANSWQVLMCHQRSSTRIRDASLFDHLRLCSIILDLVCFTFQAKAVKIQAPGFQTAHRRTEHFEIPPPDKSENFVDASGGSVVMFLM